MCLYRESKSIFCIPCQPATLHKAASEAIKMSLRDLFQHCPDCGSMSKFFQWGSRWTCHSLSRCQRQQRALLSQHLLKEVKVLEQLTQMCPTEAPLKGEAKWFFSGKQHNCSLQADVGHSGKLPSQVHFHSSGSSHMIWAVCARLNSASLAASPVHLIRMLKLSHLWFPLPLARPSSCMPPVLALLGNIGLIVFLGQWKLAVLRTLLFLYDIKVSNINILLLYIYLTGVGKHLGQGGLHVDHRNMFREIWLDDWSCRK